MLEEWDPCLRAVLECLVGCFRSMQEVGLSVLPCQDLGRLESQRSVVGGLSEHENYFILTQKLPSFLLFLNLEAQRPASVSWGTGVTPSDRISEVRSNIVSLKRESYPEVI